MSESPEFHRLSKFMKLIDNMLNDASKAQIAEAARILSLQVGHYQRKFGVLPIDVTLELLHVPALSKEQAGWVADGLEIFAAVIAIAPKDDEPKQVTR
jgi:hypothetical protein